MFQMVQYVLTNAFEIMIQLNVGIPKHSYAFRFQKFIALSIIILRFFLIMLCAVQLNGKFCTCAIEINNVIPYNILAMNRIRK